MGGLRGEGREKEASQRASEESVKNSFELSVSSLGAVVRWHDYIVTYSLISGVIFVTSPLDDGEIDCLHTTSTLHISTHVRIAVDTICRKLVDE